MFKNFLYKKKEVDLGSSSVRPKKHSEIYPIKTISKGYDSRVKKPSERNTFPKII